MISGTLVELIIFMFFFIAFGLLPLIYWVFIFFWYKKRKTKKATYIAIIMASLPFIYTYSLSFNENNKFQIELKTAMSKKSVIEKHDKIDNIAVFYGKERPIQVIKELKSLGFKEVLVVRHGAKSNFSSSEDLVGVTETTLEASTSMWKSPEKTEALGSNFPLRLFVGGKTTIRENPDFRHYLSLELRLINKAGNKLIDYWEPNSHLANSLPVCIPINCIQVKSEEFYKPIPIHISDFMKSNL